ncbi:MotA/TolQ/ExbB proton channel family protein [uncultured Kordia sp.]|uniref:MotA/TolQ/ExbB proton channel family protein n=1 Tax=uncultured Kordia sp. TaxID=507699 RepID=UPI0026051FE1|nr:MotA/TolQ/ExbB proton channel family protein [uncultured Kordia sp.]
MNSSGINYITIFETVLIVGIIFYQLVEAYRVRKKINGFSKLIPAKNSLSVKQLSILKNEDSASINISQLNSTTSSNPVFKEILNDINSYLRKHHEVATDFDSLKDITERHLETEDEAIQQTLSIPLYLGLMGTILGIIFGLANLFFVSNSENDFEIQGFLIGVAIAMCASLIGLAVTVFNSNYVYKKARIKFDKAKNQFYNFIQIKLLSQEDQKVSADVITIHNSITDFNTNFSTNIENLGKILLKNYDAVIAQDEILSKLEKVDIYKFAEANAIIFRELKEGATEFQQLNSNVKTLNTSIQGTTELTFAFNALLQKTNNFEALAEKLDQGVQKSNELGHFLQNHFTVIEQRGEILDDAVKDYDDMLVKSLVALRKYTEESIESIKTVIKKEEDLLAKSFEQYSSELSYLPLLNDLTEKSDELKNTFATKLENNEKVLETILVELKKTNDTKDENNIESLTENFKKQSEDLRIELSNKLERNEKVLEAILEELKKNYSQNKKINNNKATEGTEGTKNEKSDKNKVVDKNIFTQFKKWWFRKDD